MKKFLEQNFPSKEKLIDFVMAYDVYIYNGNYINGNEGWQPLEIIEFYEQVFKSYKREYFYVTGKIILKKKKGGKINGKNS